MKLKIDAKCLGIFLRFLFLVSLICPAALASNTPLSTVPCSEWYSFGSIETSISVDLPSYSAGELIWIDAVFNNTNDFPIVDGMMRGHLIYKDGVEEYILDEFVIAEDINLMPNESQNLRITYLPPTSKSGEYLIASYFISSNSFNLDGVSFLRGVYGSSTQFTLVGDDNLLFFDTSKLTLDGAPQSLHEFFPLFEQGQEIEVAIPIKNLGEEVSAKVTYELFDWDDLRAEDLLARHTRSDELELGSEESQTLRYTVPKSLKAGAYLLRISAKSEKNDALVKIRVPVEGKHIKLNFAGIDSFPLEAGAPAKIFMCVSNSAAGGGATQIDENGTPLGPHVISEGVVEMSLYSGDEKVAVGKSTGLGIGGPLQGYELSFTPQNTYKDLLFKVSAKDEDGNLEEIELPYIYNELIDDLDLSIELSVYGNNAKARIFAKRAGEECEAIVNIYVKDANGRLVELLDGVGIDGRYSHDFSLPSGRYELRVVEPLTALSSEAQFVIEDTNSGELMKTTSNTDGTFFILVLFIAITVFALFYKTGKLAIKAPKNKK